MGDKTTILSLDNLIGQVESAARSAVPGIASLLSAAEAFKNSPGLSGLAKPLPSGAPFPAAMDGSMTTPFVKNKDGIGFQSYMAPVEQVRTQTSNDERWTNYDIIDQLRGVPRDVLALRAAGMRDVAAGRTSAMMIEHVGKLQYDPEGDPTKESTIALLDIIAWANGELRLERPVGSVFHKLKADAQDHKIVRIGARSSDSSMKYALDVAAMGIFLVEHDWSAALKAEEEAEIRWPYDTFVLEFRISGKRVVALFSRPPLTGPIDPDFYLIFVDTESGWALPCAFDFIGGKWVDIGNIAHDVYIGIDRVTAIIEEQMRAVCIALDSKVAEAEVVRAPHKLNRQREKAGKLPVFDHHIINLARRHRVLPSDTPALGEKRKSPRLHFRRGHWRHYDTVKTWINWMLVGEPDLGWIDKEYRL